MMRCISTLICLHQLPLGNLAIDYLLTISMKMYRNIKIQWKPLIVITVTVINCLYGSKMNEVVSLQCSFWVFS